MQSINKLIRFGAGLSLIFLTAGPFAAHADCGSSTGILGQGLVPVKVQQKMRVLVYGVGDVVRRYIGPGLDAVKQKYGAENVELAFVDTSKFWVGTERESDMRARIATINREGGMYLDKSNLDDGAFALAVGQFAPNVVFIQTPDSAHIANMREVIRIFGSRQAPHIFFDKPFGSNSQEVRDFLAFTSSQPQLKDRIWGIDHFKAMIKPEFLKRTDSVLGGDPTSLHFYLVENHTPTDKKYPAPEATKGQADAIRREGRQNALVNGLGLDLFTTHGGAQVGAFGVLNSAKMLSIMAGQYENSPIPAETFGEVKFEFTTYRGNKVQGTGTYGKGILGVTELGPDYNDETFALDLRRGNRRVVANFSAGFIDIFENGVRTRRIDGDGLIVNRPYDQIMDNTFRFVALGEQNALSHRIDPKDALVMLEWAEFIQKQVKAQIARGTLPVYPTYIGPQPPTVEQIRENIRRTPHRDGLIWSGANR